MAEGKPWRYEYFDNMNTVAYLNLVQFKIIKSKEERRKRKLHEMMRKNA